MRLCEAHTEPAGEPGTGTQPGAAGAVPGLQSPSSSKPNSGVPGAESGSAMIELEELFWTPISESSELSYGGCVASCTTDGPALVTVIRNWQLLSASTGGHCGNACASASCPAPKPIATASMPTASPPRIIERRTPRS